MSVAQTGQRSDVKGSTLLLTDNEFDFFSNPRWCLYHNEQQHLSLRHAMKLPESCDPLSNPIIKDAITGKNRGQISKWYHHWELDDITLFADQGDLVEIKHDDFTKWGVYAGVIQGHPHIIHLDCYSISPANNDEKMPEGMVSCSKLVDTAGKNRVRINNFRDCFIWNNAARDTDIINERIHDFNREDKSNASMYCNSEAFARFCRYGDGVSFQSGMFLFLLAVTPARHLVDIMNSDATLVELTSTACMVGLMLPTLVFELGRLPRLFHFFHKVSRAVGKHQRAKGAGVTTTATFLSELGRELRCLVFVLGMIAFIAAVQQTAVASVVVMNYATAIVWPTYAAYVTGLLCMLYMAGIVRGTLALVPKCTFSFFEVACFVSTVGLSYMYFTYRQSYLVSTVGVLTIICVNYFISKITRKCNLPWVGFLYAIPVFGLGLMTYIKIAYVVNVMGLALICVVRMNCLTNKTTLSPASHVLMQKLRHLDVGLAVLFLLVAPKYIFYSVVLVFGYVLERLENRRY